MKTILRILLATTLMALAACGPGPGGGGTYYTLGGSVSGLMGSGLELHETWGDDYVGINADGAFTFSKPVRDGEDYGVVVSTQPSNPSQFCTVSNGNGIVSADNVTDVTVVCSASTVYTIGGTVSGLSGSGLVLLNNGSYSVTINANGPFTFPTPLADGTGYRVAVSTQPSNPSQSCTVSNGTGTLNGANVSDVAVICAPAGPATVSVSYGVKQVVLNWGAVSGATYYRVLKKATSAAGYAQIGGNLVTTTYADTISVHLTDWVSLRYVVEACDSNGCTASSPVGPLDSAQAIGYVKPGVVNANGGLFGFSIAISGDGNTLAVGYPYEYSAATGINNTSPGPTDTSGIQNGAVYVYARNAATGLWSMQAYVKASNSDVFDRFGSSVALSSDGNTMVVGAPGESSGATGVNNASPGQGDNTIYNSGAAYVFVRTNGAWSQQAYVKASNTGANDWFGTSTALSSDGNTLAVGAPSEESAATGVNNTSPGQGDNNASQSGAVYVYVRGGGSWFQQAYVKASNTGSLDSFGQALALSGNGDTLAVGAPFEESAATGVNNTSPGQGDNNAIQSGAVYVYVRALGAWSQQAYVKASNSDSGDFFGWSIALSYDGNLLAVGAPLEDSSGIGPYSSMQANAASNSGAAYLFNRSGTTWGQSVYIKASNTGAFDHFGYTVSLAADGLTLAVGAPWESGASTGIDNSTPGQANNSATSSGAVYVFQYETAASNFPWYQKSYAKARNTGALDIFGTSLSLSNDGTTMAVGAYYEDSAASGINNVSPGPGDNSRPDSGAAYLY